MIIANMAQQTSLKPADNSIVRGFVRIGCNCVSKNLLQASGNAYSAPAEN